MNFSPAEKIETIVLSRQSGVFGQFVALDGGASRVVVDGRTFIVRTTAHGWAIQFGPYEALSADLLDAAREAVDLADGMRGKSIASRSYAI